MVKPSPPVARLQKQLANVLLMLALVVQALIPNGYMIGARGNDGAIAISLCTSDGKISVLMDADGQIVETDPGSPAPQPDDNHTASICGFAAQSVAAFVPLQPMLTPQRFAVHVSNELPFVPKGTPGLGLAAPPPPKTGPPIQI